MKKRRIVLCTILMAIVVIVVLSIIFLFHNKAKVPEYVFLYADNQTKDYPTTLGDERFAELVYERTDGRIKIQVKCDAELGSEGDAISQMKNGGIAFARVSTSQMAEKVPEMNVLLLPYLYDDSDHMWRVLDGEIGDDFLNKVQDYDLVGLSWYDAGARNFYSVDKPITCVEDCAGMNIRIQKSALMTDVIRALGANPVEIDYRDVYDALERGTVNAAENNMPSYEAKKHYKLAKYYTLDEHMRIPEMQICSKVVWDMLSPQDQQIIMECAKESAIYERELWTQREAESKQIAMDNGTEVITVSIEEKREFRKAMEDVYQKYCGDDMDTIVKIMEY
ncbi:MAG: TRAP transporter substrate-binding protein [Lachnospiraceae bacterium]|nr:TRAP transporter substrate-binding protein [Lachnospiraceae bacterium]